MTYRRVTYYKDKDKGGFIMIVKSKWKASARCNGSGGDLVGVLWRSCSRTAVYKPGGERMCKMKWRKVKIQGRE